MSLYPCPKTYAEAEALDRADPLRACAQRFAVPADLIYLDGHSLGPAAHASIARVEETTRRDWAQGLIRSWNAAGWIDWPQALGARLARFLGASAQEVIVCDSVSVNLFKLAAAALPLTRARRILVERDDFPTDQYVCEGLSTLTGVPFERLAPGAGLTALAEGGGVLIRSLVNYRTAAVADMAAYEAAARAGGGVIVWDLSHAVGVLALDLPAAGARLATGCAYKYLNGGPGAPAFVFAAEEAAAALRSPIPGWFGHAAPFAFAERYEPLDGAARFAAGTPQILSLAALAGALDAFDGVDLAMAQAKARALGALCLRRVEALGLPSPTPQEAHRRGGHVSVLHPEGYGVVQALIAQGIIGDFRAPDCMRFGFSPLFLGFAQVWRAMDALEAVLRTGAHRDPRFAARGIVT